jgi:hypothetical protein
MKHIGPFLMLLFWAAMIYGGIAFTVFQWRNPTANKMSFWRDFGAVMKYEKLAKYQGTP